MIKVKLVLARIINEDCEEQDIEQHNVELYQVPRISSGGQTLQGRLNVPQNSPDTTNVPFSATAAVQDSPVHLYKPQNPNLIQNVGFQTTFPVSFLLIVGQGHGLPMVKEGPQVGIY